MYTTRVVWVSVACSAVMEVQIPDEWVEEELDSTRLQSKSRVDALLFAKTRNWLRATLGVELLDGAIGPQFSDCKLLCVARCRGRDSGASTARMSAGVGVSEFYWTWKQVQRVTSRQPCAMCTALQHAKLVRLVAVVVAGLPIMSRMFAENNLSAT